MRIDGIQLGQGSAISNLTVANGTSFPSQPDEGEMFFRSDADTTIRGMYCYIGGTWDRISSTDSTSIHTGSSVPSVGNAGDLFYLNTNDSNESLYVHNGGAWVPVGGSGSSTFNVTGDVSGTIDGGTDVLTLATVNSLPQFNSFSKITVNGKGLTTATSAVGSSDITQALGYTPVNKVGDTMSGALYFDGTDFFLNGLRTPDVTSSNAKQLYFKAGDNTTAGNFGAHIQLSGGSATRGGSGVLSGGGGSLGGGGFDVAGGTGTRDGLTRQGASVSLGGGGTTLSNKYGSGSIASGDGWSKAGVIGGTELGTDSFAFLESSETSLYVKELEVSIKTPAGEAFKVDDTLVSVLQTTASTSSTTGALTVAGGVGIAGATYINNALNIQSSGTNFVRVGTDQTQAIVINPTTIGGIDVSVNSANDAVRITQTGTGNALTVEDSARPDSTPFVVTSDGRVLVGVTDSAFPALFQIHSTSNSNFNQTSYGTGSAGNGFRRSRGTLGQNAIVQNGDTLGLVNFQGANGTDYLVGAIITAYVDGTPSSTEMPTALSFRTGTATAVERFRITPSGAWFIAGDGVGSSGEVFTSNGNAPPSWAPISIGASNFSSQTANTFLAAPNGSNGAPTFRTILAADVPTLNQNTTGSAATLTTSRDFSVSGDATTTAGVGFNGSANVNLAVTLASVGTSGVKGSASSVPVFTTDAKGRVTANTDTAIAIAASQVTSGTFADGRIASSNVTQHQSSLAIAESQITDGAILARVGGSETISGTWTFNNAVTVGTPSTGSHAATKTYVDAAIAGLSWKQSVRVATTANITLSGTQTIDGVAVIAGDRVLVKDQTTTAQNGVYVVGAAAWTRAADFDSISPIDEINSAAVFVQQGTTLADSAWTQVSTVATVGTDPIMFTQFAGTTTILAGAGLSYSSNTMNVGTADAGRIVVNADNIDLATVGNSNSGSFLKFAIDGYGRVTGTTPVTASDVTGLVGASNVTIGTTAIALGGTSTTLAGLTSVASSSFTGTLTGSASMNVLKAGDTMTGNLTISRVSPVFSMTQSAAGGGMYMVFSTASTQRWVLGTNTAAETGSNAGTNFFIQRYNDAGAVIDLPLSIDRATGLTALTSLAVAGGTTLTGQVKISNGSAAAPALAFNSDPDTGLFWEGSNRIGFSTGGVVSASIGLGDFNLESNTGNGLFRIVSADGQATINVNNPDGDALLDLNTTPSATGGAYLRLFRTTTTTGARVFQVYRGDGSATVDHSLSSGTSGVLANLCANGGQVGIHGAGSAVLPSLTFSNDTNTGIFRADENVIGFSAGGGEVLRIAQSGLLVGTTTEHTMVGYTPNQVQTASLGGTGSYTASVWSNSVSAADFHILKSRGAAVGAHVAVQDADYTGRIVSGGSDGTNFINAASIDFQAEGTISTGVVPGRISFFTSNSSGVITERMRINSNGGVSFGATGTAVGTSGQVLTSNGNASPSWQAPAAAAAGTLTGTTLASNVLASSLTSVGTLGSLAVTGTTSTAAVSLNGTVHISAGSLTTSTTTANQVLNSISATSYRSVKYEIQIASGSAYSCTEVRMIHNGTTVSMVEYGTVNTSAALATFDADISGGNMRLLVTPVNAVTTIRFIAQSMVI